MAGLDHTAEHNQQNTVGAVDLSANASGAGNPIGGSKGSSVQASTLETDLDHALDAAHTSASGNHVALGNVNVVRSLGKLQKELSFKDDVGVKGDFLIPGAGKNTVTGTADKDLIDGRGGGTNTITTGGGKDSILLGGETTNRILDFDINLDRLLFTKEINPNNVVIAQGKNQDNGSLDSINNALIIDKTEGHVLASLAGIQASALQGIEQTGRKAFSLVEDKVFNTLNQLKFDSTQEGDGQLVGSAGRDKLVGRAGDDVLGGEAVAPAPTPTPTPGGGTPPIVDDHDHTGAGGSSANHVALDQVDVLRGLDLGKLRKEASFNDDVGARGDFVVTGGGKNTVIGTGDKDLIDARGGGFNTITTGGGKDSIILDGKTTNRILDFDPNVDRLLFTQGMDLNNIVVAQGKNPGKGGLNQPLDSVNNALIIDKTDGHILASLAFNKASSLQGIEQSVRKGFSLVDDKTFDTVNQVKFDRTQAGNGKLTGAQGRDKMVGGGGDDFFYVGDDGFKLNTAVSGEEFPFPTTSPGEMTMNFELKSGNLKISGKYENADGAPLFSQGETALDPKATFNGGNAAALIEGFLKVPVDSEGNKIGGLHMHLSPAGDDRGSFADATVVRYLDVTPTDAKNGTIAGDFDLNPEEQAAFLAGLNYFNLHTNVDADGDGKGGFANGEMRLNANRNVVQIV
jgi:RTX calcium-binding nonapeptide repeat (4 copies)